MTDKITSILAGELAARPNQVEAAVALLDEGATVPFIARYRKETTGGLDDGQLRLLETRLRYLRELEERRAAILGQIAAQGQLTPQLKADIMAAESKTRLEDLYLPYKQKRRTKGQIAREAGLEPLARTLLTAENGTPEALASAYVNADKGVADVQAALDGAKALLAEEFSEDPDLTGRLRDYLWQRGTLSSDVVKGQEEAGAKFSDYFQYEEAIKAIPSHRALALFRGRKEKILRLRLDVAVNPGAEHPCEEMLARHFALSVDRSALGTWREALVRHTWRIKILTRLETDLMTRLRESADAEAIQVFARNLHDLLLAAPAGPRTVMGIDPGIRTGCKIAVVDPTGKLLDTATIYPHPPRKQWHESLQALATLSRRHGVSLLAIGNGTASRETERLAAELVQKHSELKLQKIIVSEAGASVYSASELAAAELPNLDVSLRGAVSIARRLQDPLAELVKIDPKSIGVGQYQHDVSQNQLTQALHAVVEDCVNAVGVDVNTASPALLARVSGLNPGLAEKLVEHRNEYGPFANRAGLKKVPRLGDKTFEQAAGFLRIRGGDQPLDASAVHPEAYPVVERILARCQRDIDTLLGNSSFLHGLKPADFTDDRFGIPTVTDIVAELEKPGRDPRPDFKTATFREGVEDLADLEPGMVLEGVVTNVTNFGAFVDIGVHQDGLVHISELADRFVRDPREIVKPGDVVKARVIDTDLKRRRIALSMKSRDGERQRPPRRDPTPGSGTNAPRRTDIPVPKGALAQAFARSLTKRG